MLAVGLGAPRTPAQCTRSRSDDSAAQRMKWSKELARGFQPPLEPSSEVENASTNSLAVTPTERQASEISNPRKTDDRTKRIPVHETPVAPEILVFSNEVVQTALQFNGEIRLGSAFRLVGGKCVRWVGEADLIEIQNSLPARSARPI